MLIWPVSESESRSVMSDSLQPHELYSPWNSPGQNTAVGSLSFLQGIFPTQGSNPGLPYYRQTAYQLSHQGNPQLLEWIAYPFFSGSSRPRNQTRDSFIAGGFFTKWATRTWPVYPCKKCSYIRKGIREVPHQRGYGNCMAEEKGGWQ